jgi:iron complex transport system ATP-binding protein
MTIRLDQVRLSLSGKPVLNGVSAAFQRGCVTAVLGPNGAGKTSLLRVMAGIIPPDSGEAKHDDQTIATLNRTIRARQIGYLPQEANPVWNLTARELVALGRLPYRSPAAQDAQAIDDAMTATDTVSLADRPIKAMSGGERARVQFARVLAGNPDWILADEPLANLDPPHQRDVLALLRSAAFSGKGVIVVLHSLNAAARVADHIVLMRHGVIVATGAVAEVMTPDNLAATYGMDFSVSRDQGRLIIMPQVALRAASRASL